MIDTFSVFYFGHEITSTNQNIPFDETAGELNAVIDIKSYTLSEFVVAIETALNAAAVSRVFTISVDRDTRLITIAADGIFSLLISTGITAGSAAFNLMGFTGSSDLTGSASYTGDSPSGQIYEPQFKLQSFVDEEDFQQSVDASVNESTNGDIEIVRFGIRKFFDMDIKFITNTPMDGKVIKSNSTGLEDARAFLQEITKRNRFEFMKDIDDRATFNKVILEKIPGDKSATGYKLKELFNQNLPDIFETGILSLRVVT